jgi:hypothetical protein
MGWICRSDVKKFVHFEGRNSHVEDPWGGVLVLTLLLKEVLRMKLPQDILYRIYFSVKIWIVPSQMLIVWPLNLRLVHKPEIHCRVESFPGHAFVSLARLRKKRRLLVSPLQVQFNRFSRKSKVVMSLGKKTSGPKYQDVLGRTSHPLSIDTTRTISKQKKS